MADRYNFRRAREDKEYKEALFESFPVKGRVGYYHQMLREKAQKRRLKQINKKVKRPPIHGVFKSMKPKGKWRDPFMDWLR